MPDWFYRTIAQPMLFALPDGLARGVANGTIGLLGRSRFGGAMIDFLGHMRPPAGLRRQVAGVELAAPVGIGRLVDPEGRAQAGFARFGVGALEFGPVAPAARVGDRVRRGRLPDGRRGLQIPDREMRQDRDAWVRRLAALDGVGVARLVTLEGDGSGLAAAAAACAPHAEAFIVDAEQAPDCTRPVLRRVPWDAAPAAQADFAGVVLDVEVATADGEQCRLLAMPADLEARVTGWRQALGPDALVVVAGGVEVPADACALRAAGVDLLLLDAGLVFTGPGLPKRINEALLAAEPPADEPPPPERLARQAWPWAALLGAAMLGGGLMALVISLTTVLLPYDERHLGMSMSDLQAAHPHLLHFMAHDRVSLAGSMLAVAALYLGLAFGGIRRGQRHALHAVVASGGVGFVSFFFFLGFGYFDPFHAFVTVVLLQILLMACIGDCTPRLADDALPDPVEDGPWRRGLWAQLLLVIHSVGLLFAGILISTIGMGDVFVAEDLAYLQSTHAEITAISDHLLPVVAHDRATLGGMLLAAGLGMLLPVLWIWRRGRAWLWWTLAASGLPAYVCAIGIHFHVGYTDWWHLLPAFIGAGLWAAALWLGRGYLCAGRDGGRVAAAS